MFLFCKYYFEKDDELNNKNIDDLIDSILNSKSEE